MQSIKNTSIGIMLLFLSYGVYQVIMKPVPSNSLDSIEGLAILDPVEAFQVGSPSGLKTPMAENETAVPGNAIPADLLQLQPSKMASPETAPIEQREFNPPKSSLPLAEGFDEPVATLPNSDFPPSPSNSPAIETGPQFGVDADPQFMNSPGMAAIDPRPMEFSGQNAEQAFEPAKVPAAEPATPPAPVAADLDAIWPKTRSLVEAGEYQQALAELSPFYHAVDLNTEQRQQMLDWLDALAAKVIYSSEHHLRSVPYIIQPGDTIASLARQWQVPAQLIYNVNKSKIPDPNELASGVEIKLIQGPFDAEIDQASQTLTLFLDGQYAGRFKINANPELQVGEFSIVNKSAQDQIDRPFWIGLSNGASLFASANATTGKGEIGLDPREAEEVFSILSASSTVRVLR